MQPDVLAYEERLLYIIPAYNNMQATSIYLVPFWCRFIDGGQRITNNNITGDATYGFHASWV
jgi:hypothetical protein